MIDAEKLTSELDGAGQSDDGYIIDRFLIIDVVTIVNIQVSDIIILWGSSIFVMGSQPHGYANH